MQWHDLLGAVLIDYFDGSPYIVETEVDLSHRLSSKYRREDEKMATTIEELNRKLMKEAMEMASIDERLKGLTPEERLKGCLPRNG